MSFTYRSFLIASVDAIASVKQIAVDLTTDEKHVDMEFSVSIAPPAECVCTCQNVYLHACVHVHVCTYMYMYVYIRIICYGR